MHLHTSPRIHASSDLLFGRRDRVGKVGRPSARPRGLPDVRDILASAPLLHKAQALHLRSCGTTRLVVHPIMRGPIVEA